MSTPSWGGDLGFTAMAAKRVEMDDLPASALAATAKVARDAYVKMHRGVGTEDWPRRCPRPLQAPQGPLVEFLASGRGYDEGSITAALSEANEHFNRRELGRARDLYGIAYEICRLQQAYRPLLHDILLRRVLCHSMLGDFDKALEESHLALHAIPNEATAVLLLAIVHSKLGNVQDANQAFQKAVRLNTDFRDIVDCMIAFFTLQHGQCEKAVTITTQVLSRNPGYALAFLLRGDAYKYHPERAAYHKQNAASNYTTVLELDFSLQSLLTSHHPEPSQHARAEDLLLRFHPFLQSRAPRPYNEYALCRRKDPLLVTTLVAFAVTKLRLMRSSSKFMKHARRAYEELLEQRVDLEKKVRRLIDTQQRLAASEGAQISPEVWSQPVDPESESVRRYRRYWMEVHQTFGSTRQKARRPSALIDAVVEEVAGIDAHSPKTKRRAEAMILAQKAVQDWQTGVAHSSSTSAQCSATFAAAPPCNTAATMLESHPPAAPQAPLAPAAVLQAPEHALLTSSQEATRHEPHDSQTIQTQHLTQAPDQRLERGQTAPAAAIWSAPAACIDSAKSSSVHIQRPFPSARPPAAPTQELDLRSDLGPGLFPTVPQQRSSQEQAPAGFQRTGEGFDEKQWLAKALELVDSFGGTPVPRFGSGKKPPLPPSPGGSRSQGAKATLLRYRSGEGKLVEVNLMEAMEHHGLDVLPDWYSPMDRIYEVRDMALCKAVPEPPVPLDGMLGAPGHSYVVNAHGPVSHARSARSHQSFDRSTMDFSHGQSMMQETTTLLPDEETVRRYAGRLLETKHAHTGSSRSPGFSPCLR
eukprot:TRINITY_DN18935_c0_g1_i3.p1 TRINITY_DN18935_c0_g1~~TRINITY_DN18935_c0_g1_i3.p1  ORF type:complete len:812 (+),score=161.57 TRINITY_DN18935_c0_g1_i3:129-2564(+)